MKPVGPARVSLTSPHWYRVRGLAPAWNPDCRISRRRSRTGVVMIVGVDGAGTRFALNEAAWSVIGRCDGRTELDTIWRRLAEQDPEGLPPQTDLIGLVSRLVGAGILVCGDWPDLDTRLSREAVQRRRERSQRLNPLAPRVPLGSPDALLSGLRPIGALVFSRAGAVAFAVLTIVALGQLIERLDEWLAHAGRLFGDWRHWWLPVLCYPPLKAVHELAHGLAIQRFGGRVREAGIGLLLGMPAPYVDASAAEDFARPGERALVSAAGILAELALAACAVIVWSAAAPGPLRDAALVVAVIGGVSTLLFNGNPLVRLDGYYVLTDLSDMPRLAEDSRSAWQAAWRRALLGIPSERRSRTATERIAHGLYAPAAWIYRAMLLLWVAGWLGSVSRIAGLTVLALALVWLVAIPLIRLLRAPVDDRAPLRSRARAWTRAGLIVGSVGLLALVPLPDRTWLEGVVWPADVSRVRNPDAGTVRTLLAFEGERVRAGQTLMLLEDPDLDAEIDRARKALAGHRTAWLDKLQSRSAEAASAREGLHRAERHLEDLMERRARLRVTAPTNGRLRYVGSPADLPGRHVGAGTDLAVIESGLVPQVRALADQFVIARLAEAETPPVVAVADDGSGRLLPARLEVDAPTAVARLPHPALAGALGGPVEARRDPKSGEWFAQSAHYPVSVAVQTPVDLRPETRARVLVSFGRRPLILQLADRVHRTIAPRLAPDWS